MEMNETSGKQIMSHKGDSSSSSNEGEKIEIASFTETLDNFILFAEKVLQYDTTGELKLTSLGSQSNAVQAGLSGYRGVYNKTRSSSKHMEKFREVYLQCRPQFLKEIPLDAFMEWFENKGFTIMPQEKSRNKIHLTIIFRNCVRIAEHIAAEAEKHPEKESQLLNDPAAVYPEHFMLYLFRLFYHCADETDRQTMLIIRIEELETNLGLRKNEVPLVSDGLSDLFSAAREMAEGIGLNIPKNTPAISGTQFKEVLTSFTKNEDTKKALKNVFDGVNINDPKEIPSAIGKLLNKMATTAQETPEAVKRANEATSDNHAVISSK